MSNVNLTEQDYDDAIEYLLLVVAGHAPDYVPVTDEDQLDATEDRDIVSRVFKSTEDDSFWRVIWAYVYAPGDVDNPTSEILEFFEVAPVERTFIDYVEIVPSVEDEEVN